MFHAYDKATGADIWQTPIPGPQTSLPMTYVHQGRQYVVVGVRGNATAGTGAQLDRVRAAASGAGRRRARGPRPRRGRRGGELDVAGRLQAAQVRLRVGQARSGWEEHSSVSPRRLLVGATAARAAARDGGGRRGRRACVPRVVRELPRAGRRSGAGRRSRARAVQARADRPGSDRHHPEGHPQHRHAGHELQPRAGGARRGLPALGGGVEAQRRGGGRRGARQGGVRRQGRLRHLPSRRRARARVSGRT